MTQIKNYDQAAEKIREAYEDAMRNTHMRFAVYLDGESGGVYIFGDVAGGNSEPESAWNGTDSEICEFCYQNWKPGDGDEMYLQNLLDYTGLDDGQKAEIISKVDDFEMTVGAVEEMYPDALEEYNNNWIDSEMGEFDPNEYINEFERRQ